MISLSDVKETSPENYGFTSPLLDKHPALVLISHCHVSITLSVLSPSIRKIYLWQLSEASVTHFTEVFGVSSAMSNLASESSTKLVHPFLVLLGNDIEFVVEFRTSVTWITRP